MFNEETLFILGAGASWPYGYPTGKKLITEITNNMYDDICLPIDPQDIANNKYNFNYNDKPNINDFKKTIMSSKTSQFSSFESLSPTSRSSPSHYKNNKTQDFLKIPIEKIIQFRELKEKLEEFDPVSIDAFLRDNRSLSDAGKTMIIYSLLKNENKDKFCSGKQNIPDALKLDGIKKNENDNWYSFLLNDILSGCADNPENILNNNLNIITFNYDMSLDYYLHSRLKKIESLNKKKNDSDESIADKFLRKLVDEKRINHVYGQLYDHNKIEHYSEFKINKNEPSAEFDDIRMKHLQNDSTRFFEAFQNREKIWLMNEERNHDGIKEHYFKIREQVRKATDIIIIGFGFDRDNLDKLGFPVQLYKYREFFAFDGDGGTIMGKKNGGTIKGKKIRYLDYGGKMGTLAKQFEAIVADAKNKDIEITVIRSEATNIAEAYQNDFKIYLF